MSLSVSRMASDRTAVALAIAASACWGIGIVAAKAGLDRGVPPLSFAVGQLGVSVVVLSAIGVLTGARSRGAAGRQAALSGIIEYGLAATLVVVGVSLTSVGNASIINASEPVFIVLAAMLLLRERIARGFLVPLAAMIVGLLAVMGPDLAETGAPRIGDLLVLASAVFGALYAVLSRQLVADIPPLAIAVVQQASGFTVLAGLLAFATLTGAVDLDLTAMREPTTLSLIVVSGLLQHAAAVWLHLAALRRMPASVFAIYLGLVPFFALVAGFALLGDSITINQMLGGGLVVAAAILSTRLRKEPR